MINKSFVMNFKGIFLLAIWLMPFVVLKANLTDSTIVLEEVVAKGVKFDGFSIGAKVYSFDSIIIQNYSSNSLADLLLQHSQVSLTTYGPGGVANVSMRGGTSDHTTIIWNGFNLRPPMSGNINFSAMPVGFINQVYIQSGGSSTMYGSGASTGIIFLCDELKNSTNYLNGSVALEEGSFRSHNGMAKLSFCTGHFASSIKVGYQSSDNNFSFQNTEKTGTPTDTLKHAGYVSKMVSQQNSLMIGKRSKIESDIWYVNHYKDIPSLMSDYEQGKANQTDDNLRVGINYSTISSNWYIKYRTGLFYDKVRYLQNSTLNPVESVNQSYSFINEVEGKYSFSNKHKLFLGINNTFEKAVTDQYISDTSRNRFSVFGRYLVSLFSGRFDLSTEARQEIIGDEAVPFVVSFGACAPINKYLILKSSVAKHYSIPDMNDIYWKEDAFACGNKDLKPEYGWNAEIGALSKIKNNNIEFNNEITCFQSSIHDLIVWLPAEDGKWKPNNLNFSISSGIEFTGHITKKIHQTSLSFYYIYSYTNSQVFENADNMNNNSENPRIYVPKHKASVSANIGYKNIHVIYSQNYVGKRYYDYEHTLDSYSLAETSINYFMKTKKMNFYPYLKIRNLFNVSYQVMNAYAQPPRAYYLGLNISF